MLRKRQLSYTMNTIPSNINNNNTVDEMDKCNTCLRSYNIYGGNINVGAYFQKLSRYGFSFLFSFVLYFFFFVNFLSSHVLTL